MHERERTIRALAVGAGLGAILAASNVYTGLKIAFLDGGAITAAVIGFVLVRIVLRQRDYGRPETNVTQATAASAAVTVAVTGLAGPVPAMELMGLAPPMWVWVPWGIALGCIGIALATVLQRTLLDDERLPFPTGAATAAVIRAMTERRGEATSRARILVILALVAGLVTWLRDSAGLLPAFVAVPVAIGGLTAAELGLGFAVSPLVLATGWIAGIRTTLAMLVGSALAWLVAVPWLAQTGVLTDVSYTGASPWLMWPAVALLTSSVLTSFVAEHRAAARALRDIRRALDGGAIARGPALGLLACVAALVGLGWGVLGLHPLVIAAALGMTVVFAGICGRAAGETDIAPVGAVGAMTQVTLGTTGPMTALAAGSITAGASAQTAQSLWAFKTTRMLGGRVRPVVLGQLVGVVVGAVVSVPVYRMIVDVYGLGTESMPAWGATTWRATAEIVQSHGGALPASGMIAAIVAGLCGVVLTLLARMPRLRWIPSPIAIGIGVMLPASFTATAALGAAVLHLWSRHNPRVHARLGDSIGAAGIAGESLAAVVIAIVAATS